MIIHGPNVDELVSDPDADIDLTDADFGDSIESVAAPEAKAAPAAKPEAKPTDKAAPADKIEAPERDLKGRFVKTEPEAEPEPEAEAEPEPEGDDENLPIRLNKMKSQRDALAERNRFLETQLAQVGKPAPEPKVDPAKVINDKLDGLYEQAEEARAEGDTKAAAAFQRQIDGLNRDLNRLESTSIASVTAVKMTADQQYDAILDIMESTLPMFNPRSDEFDQKLVAAFEFQVSAFEKAGMSAPNAARYASQNIFGFDPLAPKAAAKVVTPPAPAVKKDAPAAKTKDMIQKAIDTVKKQPPDSSTSGLNRDDTGEIDLAGLTDEEFAALPEATKAKYRGDNG